MTKLLVISGASRGIGLATAKQFASEGYAVINLSRNRPPLDDIDHLAVDLSNQHSITSISDQLTALCQKAQSICLIHNAAVLNKDTVENVGAQVFQEVLQLNVIAASQLNQIILPLMGSSSSILYVSSTLGQKAVANTCSYVTSKHAQIGLMKATCQDLMGKGIHTAAICPGFTDTEMLGTHVGHDSETLQYFAGQTSFNRLLRPEEIANTLWFCAQNPAINGSIIEANLGQKEY